MGASLHASWLMLVRCLHMLAPQAPADHLHTCAASRRTPSGATVLRRSHEADVDAAGIVGGHEYRLFTGVADATRWRRYAMIRHPACRGVHAARAVQGLERPGPAPGEGIGCRAGL